MVDRKPNWLLPAQNVKNVEGDDFETLVRQFLTFELATRHVNGQIHGPSPKYTKDQGMDIEVVIGSEPRILREAYFAALTGDHLTTYCVSCKTGNSWKKKLLTDAKKQAPKDTLAAGGHFVGAINIQLGGEDRKKLLVDLSKRLAKETGQDFDSVVSRVQIIDANAIADFYAYHPFLLNPNFRQKLGIPNLLGLLDYDAWMSQFDYARGRPDFVSDAPRTEAISSLSKLLANAPVSSESEVVWVCGPPGAGKTRLVSEAIGDDDGSSMRALASSEIEYGMQAVNAGDATTLNDLILVVDECPARDVAHLAATFRARSRGQGGVLILIGPQDTSISPQNFDGVSIVVAPLDDDASRQLIVSEIGVGSAVSDGLIERVLSLTEGYPWFAVLLARALREDSSALPPGSTHWQAAALAITGALSEYGGNTLDWETELAARSKALLAILLTEGIDWNSMPGELAERLGQALGMPWLEVREAAGRCFRRGVVRVQQNWRYKYVTPNNLARHVATHLLHTPLSLGSGIRGHLPELRSDLYDRLELLQVESDVLNELAEDDLRPFLSTPDLKELADIPLTFYARRVPAETARLVRAAVDRAPIEALRENTGARRSLVYALTHICRRKDGFEDAEAALFRLALAENEGWSNNATGVWSNLFMGALSLTWRSFDERLEILKARFAPETTREERLLALEGLKDAVGPDVVGPMYTDSDKMDGDWYQETVGSVRDGKRRAWGMLVQLTSDPFIAPDARAAAAMALRGSQRWGATVYAMDKMSEVAGTWSPDEQAAVRRALQDIAKYDREEMDAFRESHDKLRSVLEPRDYHARLLDAVGQHFPGEERVTDRGYREIENKIDDELAREGLAAPLVPLLQEVDWLESRAAVRSVPFMFRVGMADSELLLLEALTVKARPGDVTHLLSAYVAGFENPGRSEEFDRILNSWRGDPSLAAHTLLSVWRAGATSERVSWVVEDLKAGLIPPELTGYLAWASFGSESTLAELNDLIEVLAAMPEQTPRVTALDLLMSHSLEGLDEPLLATLEKLVIGLADEDLQGMGGHIWERGGLALLRMGRSDVAISAAVAAIASAKHYGSDREAWNVLQRALDMDAEVVWNAISRAIDANPESAYRIAIELRGTGFLDRMSEDSVMSWIGDDEDRAHLVAFMCDVHSPVLPEIVRRLLMKFGPDGSIGRELAARAHTTDTAVTSLAGFAQQQHAKALGWASDADENVSRWGDQMAREMKAEFEARAAEEEFRIRNRG